MNEIGMNELGMNELGTNEMTKNSMTKISAAFPLVFTSFLWVHCLIHSFMD